jgi:hypothetical protein
LYINVFFNKFLPICKKYFEERTFFQKFFFRETNSQKMKILVNKLEKILTLAHNTKGCLKFSDFIFWISSNVAKYIYGWSQLEPNHKIEKLEIAVFLLSIPRGI